MSVAAQPHQILRYRLTTADALAYGKLPGELRWRGKLALFTGPFVVGLLASLFDDWSPLWWWIGVGLLLLAWYAVSLVIHTWLTHRRARKLAAREGKTEIEDWVDHLTVRSESGVRHIAMETIGKVLVTDGSIFVLYHGGPTIIPLRAFADRPEMQAFGAELDRRSADAVP